MQTAHRRAHFRFWIIAGPLVVLALVLIFALRPDDPYRARLTPPPTGELQP